MTLGRVSLLAVFALAGYGITAAINGARRGRAQWVESARRSVYAMAALTLLAALVLEIAYWRDDFSFRSPSRSARSSPGAWMRPGWWRCGGMPSVLGRSSPSA